MAMFDSDMTIEWHWDHYRATGEHTKGCIPELLQIDRYRKKTPEEEIALFRANKALKQYFDSIKLQESDLDYRDPITGSYVGSIAVRGNDFQFPSGWRKPGDRFAYVIERLTKDDLIARGEESADHGIIRTSIRRARSEADSVIVEEYILNSSEKKYVQLALNCASDIANGMALDDRLFGVDRPVKIRRRTKTARLAGPFGLIGLGNHDSISPMGSA